MSLLLLEGVPPRRFGGCDRGDLFVEDCEEARVFSLRGDCEVVVKLAISRVGEKLTIRKRVLTSCRGLEKKVSLRDVGFLRGPAPLQH